MEIEAARGETSGDQPTQQPMRAGQKIKRNPTTDQKRARREQQRAQTRKGSYDDMDAADYGLTSEDYYSDDDLDLSDYVEELGPGFYGVSGGRSIEVITGPWGTYDEAKDRMVGVHNGRVHYFGPDGRVRHNGSISIDAAFDGVVAELSESEDEGGGWYITDEDGEIIYAGPWDNKDEAQEYYDDMWTSDGARRYVRHLSSVKTAYTEEDFLSEALSLSQDQAELNRYRVGGWTQDQYEAYMHAWAQGKAYSTEAENWARNEFSTPEVERLYNAIMERLRARQGSKTAELSDERKAEVDRIWDFRKGQWQADFETVLNDVMVGSFWNDDDYDDVMEYLRSKKHASRPTPPFGNPDDIETLTSESPENFYEGEWAEEGRTAALDLTPLIARTAQAFVKEHR